MRSGSSVFFGRTFFAPFFKDEGFVTFIIAQIEEAFQQIVRFSGVARGVKSGKEGGCTELKLKKIK